MVSRATLENERSNRASLAAVLEREGFEPSVRYKRTPDFESGTFNRSATSPEDGVSRADNDTGQGGAGQGGYTVVLAPERPDMSEILVPVSFGELLDKIAILQIKSERMSDEAKLANVRNELSALENTWMAHPAAGQNIVDLRAQLKAVNERLWVIEDDIRIKEKAQEFDAEFIRLARAVYFENDDRARIKKDINLALGSSYVEEKSYQDYRAASNP